MIQGIVVGIVKDNIDPEKMNRVLVEIPTESTSGPVETFWCRMISPMAGQDRGWVSIPEIGTEVVLGFAYRSLHPYVLGAVYNGGDDKPEPYKNDDGNNDKRVFWSRNDHLLIFDDTDGAEKVEIGAQASTRLDVTSAPIYQTLDSSQKTITEFCDGDTEWEAVKNISIKCTDFSLEASNSIVMKSGATTAMKTGANLKLSAGAQAVNSGSQIHANSGNSASPKAVLPTPEHIHPPTKP